LPYTNQPVNISYQINGGTSVTKTVHFSGASRAVSTFSFDSPVDLSTPGTYNFLVSFTCASDGYPGNNSANYPVNVVGKPVVNLGGVRDTLKTALPFSLDAGGSGGYSYLWQDGQTTQTHNVTATTTGWYKVIVNNQGCQTKDSVFVTEGPSSIHKLADQATVSVFPNPAGDLLHVNLSLKAVNDVMLEIVSSEGRTVINRKLTGSMQYLEIIDVTTLPKGMYYIRVVHKDWVVTDKVLVQ
jgi:hypothetical protein